MSYASALGGFTKTARGSCKPTTAVTAAAYKDLQKAINEFPGNNIAVDGIIGKGTLAALERVIPDRFGGNCAMVANNPRMYAANAREAAKGVSTISESIVSFFTPKPEPEKLEAQTPAAKSLLDKLAALSAGILTARQKREKEALEAQVKSMQQAGVIKRRPGTGLPGWVLPTAIAGGGLLLIFAIAKGRKRAPKAVTA
jgi:lysozyme family protein